MTGGGGGTGTFSIEETRKRVGEGDEKAEHVHLQYGWVARIHLQNCRQKLEAVRPAMRNNKHGEDLRENNYLSWRVVIRIKCILMGDNASSILFLVYEIISLKTFFFFFGPSFP